MDEKDFGDCCSASPMEGIEQKGVGVSTIHYNAYRASHNFQAKAEDLGYINDLMLHSAWNGFSILWMILNRGASANQSFLTVHIERRAIFKLGSEDLRHSNEFMLRFSTARS